MKSNVVNTMLLTQSLMDISMPKASNNSNENEDTFMKVLSERIAARKENGIENRSMRAALVSKDKNDVQMADKKSVNEARAVFESEKPDTKTVDGPKTAPAKSSNAIKSKEADRDNKLSTKEEIEGEINSLEAMIALLEELMARLDVKTVTIEHIDPIFSKETLLPAGKESISPMELLPVLMTQNIEKLKELIDKAEQSQQSPEIKAFMEKIVELLEKLDGKQENIAVSAQVLSEIDNPANSKEDIIKHLKAQCGQLIGKLKEQVATIKDALNSDQNSEIPAVDALTDELTSVGEGQVTTAKNEVKTQTESKDTNGKASNLEKKDETAGRQIVHDNDNSFDNFIMQNRQIMKEPIKETVTLGKLQFPLSEKPLAQTVTNQVMMKVKLMAGESKQEMEMHLKPESLGKLSLKIVHERGEILAKITAENQQVKEILESNMQMLKDALEKSGLTVQSLSVSVGNGNGKNQNKGSTGDNTEPQTRSIATNHSKPSIIDVSEIRAKIEREYYDNTSQINLTA